MAELERCGLFTCAEHNVSGYERDQQLTVPQVCEKPTCPALSAFCPAVNPGQTQSYVTEH